MIQKIDVLCAVNNSMKEDVQISNKQKTVVTVTQLKKKVQGDNTVRS